MRSVRGRGRPRSLVAQAARAVLGEVARGGFFEFWWAVGQAEGFVSQGVAFSECAAGWRVGEIGRGAGDGVEGFAFGVGGRDAFHQRTGVGVEGIVE